MSVFQIVSEIIIKALQEGVVPWRKPWRASHDVHQNLITRKPYRGINIWMLSFQASLKGFQSPYWITENQARQKGGSIKSRPATIVVKYIPVGNKPSDDLVGSESTASHPHESNHRLYPRYYRVYNVEQTEGLETLIPPPSPIVSSLPITESEKIQRFNQILENYPNPKPALLYTGNRAFYSPHEDKVVVPKLENFSSWAEWAATNFHEFAHSSGHPTRLKRKGITNPSYFGSHTYSVEELIAEMTSSFLAYDIGIFHEVSQNSAAYIDGWYRQVETKGFQKVSDEEYCQGWIGALAKNHHLFFEAARQAEKAAEFILGRSLFENLENTELDIDEGLWNL